MEQLTKKIIHIAQTDSTNDHIRRLPADEDADITVVWADHQTAGRGQGTNRWESEAGKNLLFSLRIHPHWVPVGRQFLLSMAEALALKDVLDGYTDGISLKWPNDIYWQDRKLGGTLIETSLDQRGLKDCIFGTGLNINQHRFRSDAPNPVSLCQIIGHETDIEAVLHQITDAFIPYYNSLRNGRYGDISQAYHDALWRRNGFWKYRDTAGDFEAAIVEVEDDGHLVLRDPACHFRRYAFKEVQAVLGDGDETTNHIKQI